MTILYFVIALGVLVFIHEFGHFIVAKIQGIGVEKFSLGFGPRIFSFRRGETEYLVSALPLGGYVKLKGEDAESEDAKDPRSYSAKPIRQRVRVVFAGPFMNLLLALFIMPVIFMMGRLEPIFFSERPVVIGVRRDSVAEKVGLKKGDEILKIDGVPTQTWKDFLDFVLVHPEEEVVLEVQRDGRIFSQALITDKSPETHAGLLGVEPSYFIGNEPVIDEVTPGSPAASGGIQIGDEVIEIDQAPVESWTDMSEKVGQSEGRKMAVVVRRKGETLTVFVVPEYDEALKKWLMGVKKDIGKRGDAFVKKKYSFGEAILEGTRENIKLTGLTLSVLGRLVTFRLSYKTLGGPIRIAQASAMAAKSGFSEFLYFLAFMSLQLGLLNLLPIPVLDGGHLLFFGMEGVLRKPLPARIRGAMEQVGFVLLITLMLLVTLNDVDSVWGFREILGRFKNIF